MKLKIEVNEGSWKEVDVQVESIEGSVVEFVKGTCVVGVDALGEELELEVVRFDCADNTVDLFSSAIGGLDTVSAKEIA